MDQLTLLVDGFSLRLDDVERHDELSRFKSSINEMLSPGSILRLNLARHNLTGMLRSLPLLSLVIFLIFFISGYLTEHRFFPPTVGLFVILWRSSPTSTSRAFASVRLRHWWSTLLIPASNEGYRQTASSSVLRRSCELRD